MVNLIWVDIEYRSHTFPYSSLWQTQLSWYSVSTANSCCVRIGLSTKRLWHYPLVVVFVFFDLGLLELQRNLFPWLFSAEHMVLLDPYVKIFVLNVSRVLWQYYHHCDRVTSAIMHKPPIQGCHSKNVKKEEISRELKLSAFFKKFKHSFIIIISI